MAERTAWYRRRQRWGFGCWLAVVLGWVVGVPLIFHWSFARGGHDLCLNQQKMLQGRLLVYSSDHDGRLPPHDRWVLSTAGKTPAFEYGCPTLRRRYYWPDGGDEDYESERPQVVQEVDYQFAEYLSEAYYDDIPRPRQTLILWDMDPDTHEPAFRHRRRINVAYVDGHGEGGLGRDEFAAAREARESQ